MSVDIRELVNVSVVYVVILSLLTGLAYLWLSSYLRKWKQLAPIPGITPTYPILGNALSFKSNGRGRFTCVNQVIYLWIWLVMTLMIMKHVIRLSPVDKFRIKISLLNLC